MAICRHVFGFSADEEVQQLMWDVAQHIARVESGAINLAFYDVEELSFTDIQRQ